MGTWPYKRLATDDVPAEQRGWVERALTGPLNRMLEPLRQLLAGELTFGANLNAQVEDVVLTVPAGGISTAVPVEFRSRLKTKCAGVWPIRVEALDDSGKATGQLGGLTSPAWDEKLAQDQRNRVVRILAQDGLSASTRYRVRWLLIGE